MGIRTGSVAAVVLLLTATGCSASMQRQPNPGASGPSQSMRLVGPTPLPAPYLKPDPAARRTAARFVNENLSYDSTREPRDDFLRRVRPLTTRAERMHLARSGRAKLNWSAMRARHERSKLTVTGVSVDGSYVPPLRCVVTAVRRTQSEVATTRDFVRVSLELRWTQQGWKVASSSGGGL